MKPTPYPKPRRKHHILLPTLLLILIHPIILCAGEETTLTPSDPSPDDSAIDLRGISLKGSRDPLEDLHHRKRRRRARNSFLLRSDGPGHVLFSADEVRRDWCRTIPFNQTITGGRGCRNKVFRNNLCYGQCNSFFIPQTERSGSKVAFQSCSFCKPHRLRWVNVTLRCPGRTPHGVQKTVLKIESCRCIAAEREDVDRNLQYLQKPKGGH